MIFSFFLFCCPHIVMLSLTVSDPGLAVQALTLMAAATNFVLMLVAGMDG